MAQYTKHPVSAPPRAPERESTGHLLLRGYIILVLFTTFAHSAIYNLVGEVGAVITLAAFRTLSYRRLSARYLGEAAVAA